MQQPVYLTYGIKGLQEIGQFLREHRDLKHYTLSIFDTIKSATIEVTCPYSDFLQVISFVSTREHSFPAWIGINDLSDSIVVGMALTKGCFDVPCAAKWDGSKLVTTYKF